MHRTVKAIRSLVLLLVACRPVQAQGWPGWATDEFATSRRQYREPPPPPPSAVAPSSTIGGDVRDGGERPDVAPLAPPVISFTPDFPANSIVIDTGGRKLYYVLPGKRAYAYSISVGREGFSWTGTERISRKQDWPDWYPPAEMRERDPSLPEKMTGGVKNPLGATALYLGNTLYRIHGTADAKSIGQAASSGCFRMLNSNVRHLASIVEIGATVHVVASLPGVAVASANEPKKSPSARSQADEPDRRPERLDEMVTSQEQAIADRIARQRGRDVTVVLRRNSWPFHTKIVRGHAREDWYD